MIQLTEIVVQGVSDAGRFMGRLDLEPGLQVISAENAYGKSLAVTAIAWCLGLEPMLGFPDNDSTCFSEAARQRIDLTDGQPSARVLSSECSIGIQDHDGRRLTPLSRQDDDFVRFGCADQGNRFRFPSFRTEPTVIARSVSDEAIQGPPSEPSWIASLRSQ